MTKPEAFRKLLPNPQSGLYSAEHVTSGIPIPKARRVELFSSNEWEEFTEEWASSLETSYKRVFRFAGAGDMGLDVVGFISDETFSGGWDNYQCKHYDHPLTPSDVWVEIGKIIYYSFSAEFPPPRKYYLVAPKGIGTKLGRLLANPEKLKEDARTNWPTHCETEISSTSVARLEGDLLTYFENFDFTIFSSKTLVDLIREHSTTPFHAVRFGGGLPTRPLPSTPPEEIAPSESRYIQQLLEAYEEHTGERITNVSSLDMKQDLKRDFLRQRERFYHAESLRNFARDTVPTGTYEALQEEIYQGVVDICDAHHADGLARMRATVSQSAQVSVTSSALSGVTKVQDKQGICHQLANEDRVTWVPKA